MFNIRMGIPEMEALWNKLQMGHQNGNNSIEEEKLLLFSTLNDASFFTLNGAISA